MPPSLIALSRPATPLGAAAALAALAPASGAAAVLAALVPMPCVDLARPATARLEAAWLSRLDTSDE